MFSVYRWYESDNEGGCWVIQHELSTSDEFTITLSCAVWLKIDFLFHNYKYFITKQKNDSREVSPLSCVYSSLNLHDRVRVMFSNGDM